MDPSQPTATGRDTPSDARWLPVRHRAARAGVLAVIVLAIAGCAWLYELPLLRTATALALSIGLGAALVANLDRRPRLAALWADVTAWIALAFVIAQTWNALWTGPTSATGLDLGLAIVLQVAAFSLARSARTAAGAG